MSKEMAVIVLGLLVAIVPYLGIPGSWRTVLLLVVGLMLAIVGFLLRGEAIARSTRGSHFVENTEPERTEDRHEREGINSLN